MRVLGSVSLTSVLVAALGCAKPAEPPPQPQPQEQPQPRSQALIQDETFDALNAHNNVRVVYIDEHCVTTPETALVYYDPAASPGSNKRLEVLWVIDKDDDLTAKIWPKDTDAPGVRDLLDLNYEFRVNERERKSGKVKHVPNVPQGQAVGWHYWVEIGTEADGARHCKVDPKVCIRNVDGSATCS